MDNTDKKLLRLIQEDSSLTHKQLAAKLNLSITPVYERLKRLERNGYISKYVALVDPETVDKTMMAYTSISMKEHSLPYLKKFEEEIQSLQEVVECYHITGQSDYLLKIVVRDMKEYQSVINEKLASFENIANVETSFVMTEVCKTTAIPL